jgi:hypothetical protein
MQNPIDPPRSGQPINDEERIEILLACLARVALQLRWLATEKSLPPKVRYSLWAIAEDCDSTRQSEELTQLEPEDECVDLAQPGGQHEEP